MQPKHNVAYATSLTMADTETSGLHYLNDRMTQIAIIRLKHNPRDPLDIEIQEEFEVKFDMEGFEIPENVRRLNGYDPKIWAQTAVGRKEAMKEALSYFEGSTFGGNNPCFDKRFMDAEAERHGLSWPKLAGYRLIAVEVLAVPLNLLGFIPNVKLETLVKFFQLGEQSHDALSDVRQSVQVYRRLLWVHIRGLTDEIVQEAVDLKD